MKKKVDLILAVTMQLHDLRPIAMGLLGGQTR